VSSHRQETKDLPTEEPPNRRIEDAWFAAKVLAAVGVLTWIVVTLQGLSHDLSQANAARDALARQVQQLGASPVAGPPGSRGEPGPAVTGPAGPAGSPGASGASGKAGAAASPEPGPTGPRGVAGSPGADSTVPGPSGAQGLPGADSTVPGPQGDQGVAGVAGAAGKDGTNGTDGRDGTDGTPGQPPAGWTYTDPAGVAYTCSPVDNFDTTAPRYTCSPDAIVSPTPTGSTNTSGYIGFGMLATTAAYRRISL
jgi:hypothetical protein